MHKYTYRKLTIDQINEIKALYSGGTQQMAIAEIFGVSQSNISHIVCGIRWPWHRVNENKKPVYAEKIMEPSYA